MTSACNSHVVPQFTLKNTSEDGEIAYGSILSKIKINGLKKVSGINNAHTFSLICRKCGEIFFRDYENKSNLAYLDSLDEKLRSKILCEMAIKARLAHISMKYKIIVLKDCVNFGKIEERKWQG